MSFKDFYTNQIVPGLQKELSLDNIHAVPRVTKVVVNVGAGEAVANKKILDKIAEDITKITGQKVVKTLARKSIAAFKIRRGMPIGVKVTLRGKRMYDFLEKLIKIVLPRVRDFSGIREQCLDSNGNMNIGLTEQTLFPEIEYDTIDKPRGLEITIVTTARNRDRGRELLKALGIPLVK